MSNFIGRDERLPVKAHHDVYSTIDPTAAFAQKTYASNVVLVVGASTGIGREVARFYARAGAATALVARTLIKLEETRSLILAEEPDAKVLVLPVDVKDHIAVAKAVQVTIAQLGKLDILVANAGALSMVHTPIAEKDPVEWWNSWEVNIRGTFNFVHAALPHLRGGHGQVVVTTSSAAQMRIPGSSDYCASKHALGRIVEFIALEYPDIKVFSIHPGAVKTDLVTMSGVPETLWDKVFIDSPSLAAATMLYLTAGKADWLSGRYISANWDLGEIERDWKDKIVAENALVSKLCIPGA